MSLRSQRSPAYNSRYSREGFQPLNTSTDATHNIPLDDVSRADSQHAHFNNMSPIDAERQPLEQEKTQMARSRGKRRSLNRNSTASTGDEGGLNKMGKFYDMLLKSSPLVRYMIYIVPLGICFAVPMIIGATVAKNASIGRVRIVWFFMWLLIVWIGLWVSKVVAYYLPFVFQFFAGIVSSGTRKYAMILKALEIELSLTGWALISLATFKPIMTRNPEARADPGPAPQWENIVQEILAATLIGMLIFLGERVLVQFVSINYHRKQFALRIRESKERIQQITTLYESSRTMFPAFCPEFAEEDSIISDTIDLILSRKIGGRGHKRTGSTTPGRVLRDVGRIGDKITSAFGNVAQEITGKQVFNPNSAHSIVIEALEKNRACEALARRIWLSFVVEGHEALYIEDVVEVLGEHRREEAVECFNALDVDGNGDVSMDEMIQTITEIGRERRAVANSMHDVDQAINVLDRLLCVGVLIAVVFIFVAFLNKNFVTTLATAGTTLLSLSFVFSVTAQEILGSCVFLFVKHPLDVGDTIYLNGTSQSSTPDQLIVEHTSLLYTVFKRVNSGRLVQIPNNVLNTLWIENISRSKAMREQLSIFCDFGTTFEDIQLLRAEMIKFVTDKENSRDFQPNIEVEVLGIGNLDKLELRVEIQHKSNWANESVRASRRSKFMCALVLALRKVPIYGPSGSGPALGEMGNPSYSVAIPDDIAANKRAEAAKALDAKRMVPALKEDAPSENATLSPTISEQADFTSRLEGMKTHMSSGNTMHLATIQETRAINQLNERDPGQDTARDAGSFRADHRGSNQNSAPQGRTSLDVGDLEDVRGMLRRATTKGRRRSGTTSSNMPPITPVGSQPPGYNTNSPQGVRRAGDTTQQSESTMASGALSSGANPSTTGAPTFGVQSAPAAPYIYPSASYGSQPVPPPPANRYDGSAYPPPINTENIPPPPQPAYVPSAGRHITQVDEEDLRGENESEEPVFGQPKMTAGGAWSAQQWRSGI